MKIKGGCIGVGFSIAGIAIGLYGAACRLNVRNHPVGILVLFLVGLALVLYEFCLQIESTPSQRTIQQVGARQHRPPSHRWARCLYRRSKSIRCRAGPRP